jgi:hypothetical protein
VAASTLRICSMPTTTTTSRHPASIWAMADIAAIEPEAHAASCRAPGLPAKAGIDRRHHPAELALSEEQFGHEVADFEGVDLGRLDAGVVDRAEDRLRSAS